MARRSRYFSVILILSTLYIFFNYYIMVLSPPTQGLSIRAITPVITTFSVPFLRFNVFPIGGRSTAIKLDNGNLWLLASHPLDQPTKDTLDGMGKSVDYIVCGDIEHTLYVRSYAETWPEARLVGPDEIVQKEGAKEGGLKYYRASDNGGKFGFEDEIEVVQFKGFANKDFAFWHKASKTLIQADLLFNLPAAEQVSLSSFTPKDDRSFQSFPHQFSKSASGKPSSWVPGMGLLSTAFHPSAWLHKQFVWAAGADKGLMREHLKAMQGWDFDRIIPCHGDVIETGGKKAWSEAYSKYL